MILLTKIDTDSVEAQCCPNCIRACFSKSNEDEIVSMDEIGVIDNISEMQVA